MIFSTLRVLTHELRTPIANLLLQVESINKESDQLPAHILEEFLKMEGEVYRLKRLAEKSRSYLETHEGDLLIALKVEKILNLNSLIADLLEVYKDKPVCFIPAKTEVDFYLDPYWFNVCLKNLVENALIHGRAPVTVSLIPFNDRIEIQVNDLGSLTSSSLEDLMKSDRRDNKSGLGLGLGIVASIIKEMNGKLIFKNNPTTFSLVLKRIEEIK